MVRTRQCDFCGGDIEPGTGTMFVHVDGTTVQFCSAKCEKNADLGREPRDQEWTESGQAATGETVVPEPATDVETPTDTPDLGAVEDTEVTDSEGEETEATSGEADGEPAAADDDEIEDEPAAAATPDAPTEPDPADEDGDEEETDDAIATSEASEPDSA